jgi:uncharacterized BrkB/YihY/UPF0761 family membrane protein
MILAILAFWYGYKKARDTGRNPILWSVICGGTFIGVQLVISFGVGIFIGIGSQMWGWKPDISTGLYWIVTLVSVVASFVSLMLLFRYLDRIPPTETPLEQPPPPPTFDQNP